MVRSQRKRKREFSIIEKYAKRAEELWWTPERCAKPIGEVLKFTGEGVNKKRHYQKFEFRNRQYELEDSVVLYPENKNQKDYVAIIKDIFMKHGDRFVYLKVQWFYRPGDVEKKYAHQSWRFQDSKDLFYSFHQDEVYAESVKDSCHVYFVQEKMQIPDGLEYQDYIVHRVYNTDNKKLWNFTHVEFNAQQRQDVDFTMAKTLSRNIKKKILKLSRRKQPCPKTCISEVEVTSPMKGGVVNAPDYKSILEMFGKLTGNSDRDKKLEELLEVVRRKCEMKEGCDNQYVFSWPDDYVPVVVALEKSLYDSFAGDIPKYNHKLEVLVDKLKTLRMLAKLFLSGQLRPDEALAMMD